LWFQDLAEFCTIPDAVAEADDVQGQLQAVPNPAADQVEFRGIRPGQTWTAHSPTGALHTMGRGPLADVSSWPAGIYAIRFDDGRSLRLARPE
jgi:hypothetical protein